jgi:hypothetical protein
MNPDSTCYLFDEMLQVKYAAYPNAEKKNWYADDDWNSEHKKIYDKHFIKKICSINRELWKYYAYA